MLQNLTVDQVRQIAEHARRTGDAHRKLIGGMRDIDLGDQPLERGSRNPSDLDTLNVLDQTVQTAEMDELRATIGALSADTRQELKALMLVGRGDFTAGQWDQAMTEAGLTPSSADVDFLSERLLLADYLNKALYQLKLL